MTGAELGLFLSRGRYRHAQDELKLQEEIAVRLGEHQIAFEREVRLSKTDRIDFMVGAIGVEVKVKGAAHAVMRQLLRYTEDARIAELVLFTTHAQHAYVATELGGKPIHRAVYLTL